MEKPRGRIPGLFSVILLELLTFIAFQQLKYTILLSKSQLFCGTTHVSNLGYIIVDVYAIIHMLCHPRRKGVPKLETLLAFFISVLASVVAYYICKWLDGDK